MSNLDMMDALQALAADKGISVDTLLAVLADALVSAYKRLPERRRVRLGHDRPRHAARSGSSPRSSTRTASPIGARARRHARPGLSAASPPRPSSR